jgi:ABC-type siderophore export system fused ATPase/permease subunit
MSEQKQNPLMTFGYALLQFVIAVVGASVLAWLFDSYQPNDENLVLVLWVVLFVLFLFLANRLMKRIRT